eukprot:5814622-Pyramimonas_sp.AAC.2
MFGTKPVTVQGSQHDGWILMTLTDNLVMHLEGTHHSKAWVGSSVLKRGVVRGSGRAESRFGHNWIPAQAPLTKPYVTISAQIR